MESGKRASLADSRPFASLPILRRNSRLNIDSVRSDAYYPQPMVYAVGEADFSRGIQLSLPFSLSSYGFVSSPVYRGICGVV